jgi:hypothetical protein
MKVGYTASEIFVVDAFAGAGTYVDPDTLERSGGSPVIAAVRARQYEEERPGKTMSVICVEKNAANRRELEQRLSGFGDIVRVLPGTFAQNAWERRSRSTAATNGSSDGGYGAGAGAAALAGGSTAAGAGADAGVSKPRSWRRICSSSSFSCGPGSIPSSSASRSRPSR